MIGSTATEASVGGILVTGGCGYLGSRLVPDLLRDPRFSRTRIRVLDSLSTGRLDTLMDLPGEAGIEFVEADILDPASVNLALDGMDAVVHLAAVGSTPVDFSDAERMEHVNRWGTTHLVKSCVDAGVERFLFASTASVYGSGDHFDEDDHCRPLGTFAQSKLAAEKSVMVAGGEDLRSTVLRLGTIFGGAPAVRFATMPNRFAYWAGVGRSLSVFGDGEQIRPLLHVADASDAIRFCLADPDATADDVFNVATGNHSVLDVVEAIRSFEPGVTVRFTDQEALTHLSYGVVDDAVREAGWSPDGDLSEGLQELGDRLSGVEQVPMETPEA